MNSAGMISELAIESAAEKMLAKTAKKRKSSLTPRRKFSLNPPTDVKDTRRKFSLNATDVKNTKMLTVYQDVDCDRKISEGCLSSILHSKVNDRNTDRRGAICEKNEVEKELLKEALKSLFQMEQLKLCSLD